MELNQALSRLLDGELSDVDAEALRERIRTEPAVAAAWARLQALPGAMAQLPVPEGMPTRATQARSSQPPAMAALGSLPTDVPMPASTWPSWPFWIAPVAALILGYLLPHPTPHVVLVGQAAVDGRVTLDLGARSLDIDGVTRIGVEPPLALARVEPTEVPMDKTHLYSAVAGAALTLAVDHGRATLRTPEGAQVLESGDWYESPAVAPPAAKADGGPSVAELQQRVVALQGELRAAKLQTAMASGQLAQALGRPVDFPKTLPNAYQPAVFEANLRAELGSDAEILEVDCSEYPCIAVVEAKEDGEGWKTRLESIAERMLDRHYGGRETPATVWLSQSVTDRGTSSTMAFAVWSPDLDIPDIQTRTKFRSETLMQSLEKD